LRGFEKCRRDAVFAHKRVADRLVIDDPFLQNAQGSEAGGVGFDLAELSGI
jgi:hypothetical protein